MKIPPLLAVLCALCWGASAFAQISIAALVTGAYDGDTLAVDAENWPDLVWKGNVRVRGVDAPEIRGECEQERQLAIAARDFVRDTLVGERVILTEVENDRYGGRVLARIHLQNGEDLAQVLIANGYGRAYDGGARQSWCGASIAVPSGTIAGGTGTGTRGDNDDSATTLAGAPAQGDEKDPLALYDDDGNGRITCAEARVHGIAPVRSDDPAYRYMMDRDNDGVVCE